MIQFITSVLVSSYHPNNFGLSVDFLLSSPILILQTIINMPSSLLPHVVWCVAVTASYSASLIRVVK